MTITTSARRLALVAVAALTAALLPFSVASAQDPDPIALDLDGDTTVEYSLRWSQVTYDDDHLAGADAPTRALIGRDDIFADSLASGVLQDNTPLLLTPSDALFEGTLSELERLGVADVTILGLEAAVSEDVADDLEAEGFNVDRLGGQTRIETAIEIAETVTSDTAILARAFATDDPTQAFADSLAAGGWAAESGFPVLLTQTEVLTGNTAAHIEAAGYDNIIIVGGDAAVSDEVEAEVAALVTNVDRVEGGNRFETAVAIAEARGYASPDDAEGVILVDGQGGGAWADGFPAANLSGMGWPIVLSNSAAEGLPAATVEWLEGGTPPAAFAAHLSDVVLICGSTVPDGDTEGEPDQCTEAADILGATVVGFVPPGEVGVTVSGTAEQGGDVTITITGAQVDDEIVVSGCGIEETTVTVTEDDIDEDGNVVLTFTIPQDQAEGDCDITVSVNGEEFVSTVTVTEAPGNVTVTDRPELVRAVIGNTVIQGQQTPTNPIGTRVTYTFDERVDGAPAVPANFHVYDAAGNVESGASATFSEDGLAVTVIFTNIDEASEVADLTVATVDVGAVQGSAADTNPEGDAPIGTAQMMPGGSAGITSAPDLLTAVITGAGAGAGETAINLTFDENAFVTDAAPVAGVPEFSIILTDGNEVACNAPAPGSSGGGGTVVGGNGTTTITIICPGAVTLTTEQVARAVVGPDAVSDTAQNLLLLGVEGNGNPLQAAEIGAAGNAANPSLVLVELRPGATAADADQAIFQFDEFVALGAFTEFFLYDGNANEVAGTAHALNPGNQRQVLVTFTPTAADNAVGGNVRDGAVLAADNNAPNQQDEVGVENASQTNITPGQTSLADLTAVRLEVASRDPFTQAPTAYRAIYTFDTALTAAGASAEYSLYRAGGQEIVCATAVLGTAGDSGTSTVRCTAFAGGATASEVGSAVLGTYDGLAAPNVGTQAPNGPEGAALVDQPVPT